MSMSAIWSGRYVSRLKLVPGPLSVANASVRPSGDHAGWNCAARSCISWMVRLAPRSYRYRSLQPPESPEKASCLPSGLHAIDSTCPTPGGAMCCSMLPLRVLKISTSTTPWAYAGTARYFPSGDHDPEEFENESASKCGLELGLVSRRIVRPVAASAMYRSKENRSRLVMNATSFPSGLMDGATSKSPYLEAGRSSRVPRSFGNVRVLASARYCSLIAAIQSFESESVVMPSTPRTAGSRPLRSAAR